MFSSTKGYRTKPPVGVRLNPLHPLSRGLVGCWLFNEGAGSVAHDISGYGNHGTLTNMSPNAQNSGWGGSKFGGGLNFDGSNDFVDLGNCNTNGLCLQNGTWTCLFKPHADINGDSGEQPFYGLGSRLLIGFRVTGGTGGSLANGELGVEWWDGAWNTIGTGISAWDKDREYHFTLVRDGTNNLIYLDGILQNTVAQTDITMVATRMVSIGSDEYANINFSKSRYFNGSNNQVQIHNRALSAAEVKQLHEDPFCNLLRVPVRYAPAAPGGLPIPVAMNYYRRRRVA